MKIKDMFGRKAVVFSLEIFPPKPNCSVESLYKTLEELKDISPDYISVTYGAGGNSIDNKTCELSSLIKNKYNIEALAHLTCISSTREDILYTLNTLKKNNVENVLALRGDFPLDGKSLGIYDYAHELIYEIKKVGDFGVAAACYPEGHIECEDLDKDIVRLKEKVDKGADYLITQLFFNNNLFYDFLNKCTQKGIKIPIEAGIMPITNKRQVERIISLCGANLPNKFIKIIDKYEHNKDALRDAGIAYAVEQIVDLISTGVDGIHLYTMNNSYIARSIKKSISSILESVNSEAI
ncbi:methylenetetrahydrofolate reductase (NADPH) [Clostridium tetanomorphum]|uniref:Methylenetetrahydrofolate reductase n=1 Tax=Clostridium tetanomorphum TaxID=1553 RepID=A0A923EAB4_CLOTT|nr:methylenetetrahydrofolate reductase [NAD(P)H] [Clostridium tetanomorphum]KAJ51051.1 5,10-methylenetetrahydrofolate reductase [Clostridium tetanomorphum DSM 665]MBC2399360.1 methylenetetrahydrofolate reductase [NAD(P)H] [Clostridium tetanomorphum]MBP1865849.1 methylenetetrahydrofolate reductase (NADPH) [Clostridium tetanomorphum]NRS85298.1 methylenetetrahydrofolate reductase (NADPH) [Clostridium tetanomorphum]NRZ98477.1 methylenetetrahydrofolate reductase (NADPH) [Clostridium tetanomorphum]